MWAVPWLRLIVAGLSQQCFVFDPRPVRVSFVVEKVALGKVLVHVFALYPLSVNPPMLHDDSLINY
jgi:hypothetical protein